jgi:hypothetical protein
MMDLVGVEPTPSGLKARLAPTRPGPERLRAARLRLPRAHFRETGRAYARALASALATLPARALQLRRRGRALSGSRPARERARDCALRGASSPRPEHVAPGDCSARASQTLAAGVARCPALRSQVRSLPHSASSPVTRRKPISFIARLASRPRAGRARPLPPPPKRSCGLARRGPSASAFAPTWHDRSAPDLDFRDPLRGSRTLLELRLARVIDA